MGATLVKPVLSTIVERKSDVSNGFRVGVAELSGHRQKMEDAHVIHIKEDWAFFGVFDGHGGDVCSAFVADQFYERLAADGCPADDAAVKKLVLDIDAKFLATEEGSGSTGAMCIVRQPETPGGKIRLHVANVGDSRVFLGKADGSIVDGGGTEMGLSTDHKPNHPTERERIERCGGTVQLAMGGVSRVNGDLAVSRAFGDGRYKETGGPGPEDRPVTVDPEMGHFECDEDDFLVIACDGVSEGEFPNPEVVKCIAQHLRSSPSFAGGAGDPGSAAKEVILTAEVKGSKDNITCMVVLFKGATEETHGNLEFDPGVIVQDRKYMEAYEAMAKRAKFTKAQALELRYNNICKALADPDDTQDKEALKEERALVLANKDLVAQHTCLGGTDESPHLSASFFEFLADDLSNQEPPQQGLGMGGGAWDRNQMDVIRRIVMAQNAQEESAAIGRVRIAPLGQLKPEVESHSALNWDDKMADLSGADADLLREDPSDNTVQVRSQNIKAWLPDTCVTKIESDVDGGDKDRGSSGYGTGPA